MSSRRTLRSWGGVIAIALVAAGCSGGDGSTSDPAPDDTTGEPTRDVDDTTGEPTRDVDDTTTATAPETTQAPLSAEERDAALAARVDAIAPAPIEPDANVPVCEQYGFACSPAIASPEETQRAVDLLQQVTAAASGSDDARTQLDLALEVVEGVDDLTFLDVDLDRATIFTFAVGAGPAMTFIPVAGQMQEGDDVVPIGPVDTTNTTDTTDTTDESASGLVRPQTFRSAPLPERYHPVGGPTNERSAAILNPFDWDVGDIVDTFRNEEQYTRVRVFNSDEANPFNVATLGSYDAVHVFSHGGGSCRSGCSSTLVGGLVGDMESFTAEYQAGDQGHAFNFCTAEGSSDLRFCFPHWTVPTNPDGVQFLAVCGSSFGFSNNGSSANVTWDGTTQKLVASRTSEEFWRLMITEGVEFDLAKNLIKDNSYDSHQYTYWASFGKVLPTTSSVWSGRNVRGRDVVEPMFDGQEPMGQVVEFNGIPGDRQPDTFPTAEQKFTIRLDGVKEGTEDGVTFKVHGDGDEWDADIDLSRDGRPLDGGEGYKDWIVTVKTDAIEIPDVSPSSLGPSAPPTDFEVRAYETAGEYTAHRGSIRLATDLTTSGPIPIFDELKAATAGVAEVSGNDLQVRFNTEGGAMEGDATVTIAAGGGSGFWQLQLTGTYDAATGTMMGDLEGKAAGGSFITGFVGEQASGDFDGTVDLTSGIVRLNLRINGQTQQYVGTIVE